MQLLKFTVYLNKNNRLKHKTYTTAISIEARIDIKPDRYIVELYLIVSN